MGIDEARQNRASAAIDRFRPARNQGGQIRRVADIYDLALPDSDPLGPGEGSCEREHLGILQDQIGSLERLLGCHHIFALVGLVIFLYQRKLHRKGKLRLRSKATRGCVILRSR